MSGFGHVLRVVSLGLTVAVSASAGPSRWDRIRDPDADKAERALVKAYHAREPKDLPPESIDQLPELEKLLALRAVSVLQTAGAAALRSPELWYYLGDALVVGDHGDDERARELLRKALAADPDSPEAANAWFKVAIASDRLHDFASERDAYTEALRSEWDRNARADIYANRGEASMSLGALRVARADYLVSLAIADDATSRALAAWGLAVALARDDDLPEALRYAWEAVQFPSRNLDGKLVAAIDLPSVFFTPDYEIFYYRALGAMAVAQYTDDPKERQGALEAASLHWSIYLTEARAHGDRWTANAEHQLKWCQRRLDKH